MTLEGRADSTEARGSGCALALGAALPFPAQAEAGTPLGPPLTESPGRGASARSAAAAGGPVPLTGGRRRPVRVQAGRGGSPRRRHPAWARARVRPCQRRSRCLLLGEQREVASAGRWALGVS